MKFRYFEDDRRHTHFKSGTLRYIKRVQRRAERREAKWAIAESIESNRFNRAEVEFQLQRVWELIQKYGIAITITNKE